MFSFSAAVAHKDENLAKRKLTLFEGEAGQISINASQQELITADVLAAVRKISLNSKLQLFSQARNEGKSPEEIAKALTNLNELSEISPENNRILTTAEKLKRNEMEKTANWWTKYYASKARLKLEKRSKIDIDDILQNSEEAYAQMFAEESSKSNLFLFRRKSLFLDVVIKQQNPIWIKAKKMFSRAGKAQKDFKSIVRQKMEDLEEKKVKKFFVFPKKFSFSFRSTNQLLMKV